MVDFCTAQVHPAPPFSVLVDTSVGAGHGQILRPVTTKGGRYSSNSAAERISLTVVATTGTYARTVPTSLLYVTTDSPITVKVTNSDATVTILTVNQLLVLDTPTTGFQILNTGSTDANVVAVFMQAGS